MTAAVGATATRVVWMAALLVTLWLVLYSPAKTSAAQYSEIIEQEYSAYSQALGDDVAARILDRLARLELLPKLSSLGDAPPIAQPTEIGTPTDRVASRMGAVTHRFFNHPYFRSIDGLVALAAFRVIAIYELLGVVLVVFIVAIIDGLAVRKARAAQLHGVSAERFRLAELSSILLFAALLTACFLPMQLPPAVPLLALIALTFAISRCVSTYHRVI